MHTTDQDRLLRQARLLVQRLARLSADSAWAHRASGIRASLDKALASEQEADLSYLTVLVQKGFDILHRAARELKPM